MLWGCALLKYYLSGLLDFLCNCFTQVYSLTSKNSLMFKITLKFEKYTNRKSTKTKMIET